MFIWRIGSSFEPSHLDTTTMKRLAKIIIVSLAFIAADADAAKTLNFDLTPSQIVDGMNKNLFSIGHDSNTPIGHIGPLERTATKDNIEVYSAQYFGSFKDITRIISFESNKNTKKTYEASVSSISTSENPSAVFFSNITLFLTLIQALDPKGTTDKTRANSGDVMNSIINKLKYMKHGKINVSKDNIKYEMQLSQSVAPVIGKMTTLEFDAKPLK